MNTPTMQPPHADDYASAVVIIGQLYAANMALVAGQAKLAEIPPTLAQLDDACLSARHDFGLMLDSEKERLRGMVLSCWTPILRAALSPRGQDHAG